MIRLTDLELIDFGRHRHIKKKLEGNIIGLSGPNGKGKTTILQGVAFGITGSIETEDNDPLSSWIRRGTRGGVTAKNAQVNLEFDTDGGRNGKIHRKITKTTTSRELTIDGMEGSPFSADKKVQQIMMDLLGVDKRALSSTVFIKQGAVDAMFGGKTDRREFYTRLLMMGHFAKIAETIEGYRRNVASSVVDLSGILDEAKNVERTATAAYESVEAQLKVATDCTEWITLVGRLSFLFGDQTAAHEAVTKELELLGSDPAARIEVLKSANKNRELRIAEIAGDRLAQSRAETTWSNRLRELSEAETLRGYHDELRVAETELTAQKAADQSVDYTTLTINLQRKVDARVVVEDLASKENELLFDVQMLEAQHTGATDTYDEAWRAWGDAAHNASSVRNDLQMREKILNEVRAARAGHVHDSTCLVCGSNVDDDSYLARTVADARAALADLDEKAAKLKESANAYKAIMDQAKVSLDIKTADLSAVRGRLSAAHTTLDGDTSTIDELRAQLDDARNKATAQAKVRAEIARLEGQVFRLSGLISLRPCPTDNQLADMRTLVANAKADCKPWNPELDTEEARLKAEVETTKTEIANLNAAQTRLQASREWLARTEAELEDLCLKQAPRIPDDIYIRGRVMTAELASEIAGKLRERQAEYDGLKGSLETARTAMVNAQSRVSETEMKIEGQKQRIDLAARLERLRDAFKPTGVSMDYLDYKFAQVAAVASDYLAESGADFTVVASESKPLSFDFIRMAPGEEWLEQSRLSGGQRVRLAVAVLRAIHALVVPNVGLLVLDEPTTHLDTEAKLALAEMLRRIGNEGGLQILVCDHDPVILDACTSIIEIPE